MIGKKLTQKDAECRFVDCGFILLDKYVNAQTKIKIQCHCGKIFYCRPCDIFSKRQKSCGKCYNKLLINKFPNIAKEWNYNKNNNLDINNVTYASGKKVWWFCPNGHEYLARIADRTSGKNCPYCSSTKILEKFNDLLTTHPKICDEWDYKKNIKRPTEISKGHNNKVWWICKKCKKSYYSSPLSRTSCKSGCPYCNESKGEKEIRKILTKLNIDFIEQYRFKNCKNKKTLPFDFYIPKHNLLIEFQGWHHYNHSGSLKRTPLETIQKRDKIKENFCIQNKINLLTIKYDQFKNMENLIKQSIGVNNEKLGI